MVNVWEKTLTEEQAQAFLYREMDHIFNCIGNGIRNKGEFFSHISIPAGQELPPFATTGKVEKIERSPYPNFQENYSLLYEMDIKDIPTDWLETALWFYQESEQYFLEGASNYSYAYPSSARSTDADEKSYSVAINGYRKEGMTDAEWHAAVSKAYECEFTGDLSDFRTRRWAKEKDRILVFITKTVNMLKTELGERN
jgi:hypothetical protein